MDNKFEKVKIAGVGVVSNSGWGINALFKSIENKNIPAPVFQKSDVGSVATLPVPKDLPEDFPRHKRFRRSSPISKFMAYATLDALGNERFGKIKNGEINIGISSYLQNGVVGFTRKFYTEVLDNPSFASPILFPETVFNAASSHISALLNCSNYNYTFIGEPTELIVAIDQSIDLLLSQKNIDGWLVLAGEELDWASSEAARLFNKNVIVGEGASAIYIEKNNNYNQKNICIEKLCGPYVYSPKQSISDIAKLIVDELSNAKNLNNNGNIIFTGSEYNLKTHSIETKAWNDAFQNQPISYDKVCISKYIGETMGVSMGLQTAIAIKYLLERKCKKTLLSFLGSSNQALGLSLTI